MATSPTLGILANGSWLIIGIFKTRDLIRIPLDREVLAVDVCQNLHDFAIAVFVGVDGFICGSKYMVQIYCRTAACLYLRKKEVHTLRQFVIFSALKMYTV